MVHFYLCSLFKSTISCPITLWICGWLISITFFSRQSSTQCTSTNLGSIWSVPVIFCNYPTQLSELMYSVKPCFMLWLHIKMRKSLSSKSIIIPLQKDFGIQEQENHKESKQNYHLNRLLVVKYGWKPKTLNTFLPCLSKGVKIPLFYWLEIEPLSS